MQKGGSSESNTHFLPSCFNNAHFLLYDNGTVSRRGLLAVYYKHILSSTYRRFVQFQTTRLHYTLRTALKRFNLQYMEPFYLERFHEGRWSRTVPLASANATILQQTVLLKALLHLSHLNALLKAILNAHWFPYSESTLMRFHCFYTSVC